jgi:limonene-1,2-epoxide hydrolase
MPASLLDSGSPGVGTRSFEPVKHIYTFMCASLRASLDAVQDPVQIFEAAVDALNRLDRDAMKDVVDAQIMFVPMRSAVTGAYLGHDGIEAFLVENEARLDLFHAEFDELRPLPDGRLLAIGHIRMRGRGERTESLYPTAGIAAFRDGRMCSWRDYGNVAAALAAAGVS